MTGYRLQTLVMLLLAMSALTVVAFDLRELFIAWYSESSPKLTTADWAKATIPILLCLTISVIMFARFLMPD